MTGGGAGGGGGGGKGGAAAGPVPAASRKLVQSLKEIVNRPEAEIYAALRDCGMDPDEAVSRLLSQGLSPRRRFSSFCSCFGCAWIVSWRLDWIGLD